MTEGARPPNGDQQEDQGADTGPVAPVEHHTPTPADHEAPAAVSRDRVVDPLTGLPVLRYRGTVAPTLRPGAPAPTGAWRLLRAERSGPVWVVDLETAGSATSFADAPGLVDDVAVTAVLETLADAERLGVAHGALDATHLWRRGDRVWVEGYGVGWRPIATAADDTRDLARSLLALPGTGLSAAMRRRLGALTGDGDTGATSDDDEPVVGDHADHEADTDADPDDRDDLVHRDDVDHAYLSGADRDDASVAAAPPGAGEAPTGASDTTPRPISAFVKAPPPGATVRTGDDAWSPLRRRSAAVVARATATPARRRRAGLLVLLLVGVALLATLILVAQRRPAAIAVGVATSVFVVDVQVTPVGLPPAGMVVLESPPGSRLTPGTVAGTVPGRVSLDREGTWRFEGRFLDRRSAPAVLDLPRERSVVLVFPDPTSSAP